ncbi:hypothetical protein FOA43_003690 [Brettanomyces nanus]|uniref:DUF962 domain-containing protein n=1 Tax=Eeniella nana TaxID=13502 RepID=A0A875SBQ7_EENNA|nr:uncharacterized protein FOA43_003690 [Brettanomyces nanus]QPG76304.1 hypothetical protein FOA43_003690 [Brettanomyces nanus]
MSPNPPLFALEDQLALYKEYHLNPINIKIHLVCIPQILFSAFVIASYVSFSDSSKYCNLGWTAIGVYELYYLILDLEAGLIAAPFMFGIGIFSNYLHEAYPAETAFIIKFALFIHFFSWAAQFYGHFHFEGNAPAVFDNFVQPLILAPYFVIFEWMFIFGHRLDLKKAIFRKAKVLLDERTKQGAKKN